jgi:FKBP-type peptidyl-prolyl cis-trans isomerase FkpA
MAVEGRGGSKIWLVLVLILAAGGGAGLWVNKDRFKEPSIGPDKSGEVATAESKSASEPRDTIERAPDEELVEESPDAYRLDQKAFMKANSTKEGVSVTESGLQFKILSESGQTDKPHSTDIVQVHYRGRLIDGIEFDSSYNYGEPAEFPLDEVIKGWTEGVQLMNIGDIYEFTIPPKLGYGPEGSGDEIPGYSVLIFEVELLDIIRP